MLEIACECLGLAPEECDAELIDGGDLPDQVSGALWLAALRMTAETPNTIQYAGDAPESTPVEAGAESCYSCWRQTRGSLMPLPVIVR